MNQINNFYQLDAWKEAHKLVVKIYKITKTFPKEEKYSLIDQVRRSASSVTANIAEGFGRFHFANKIRFYHQARGSLKETQNFIFLSKDLNYLKPQTAKNLWNQSKTCEKLINGLIRSINKQK